MVRHAALLLTLLLGGRAAQVFRMDGTWELVEQKPDDLDALRHSEEVVPVRAARLYQLIANHAREALERLREDFIDQPH